MAASLQTLQKHFKKIGKLVYLSQLQSAQAVAWKAAHVNTAQQFSQASDADFDGVTQVMTPLTTAVADVVSKLASFPTQAKTQVTTYLQKVVSPDLFPGDPNATSKSIQVITTQLVTDMTTSNALVPPSGVNRSVSPSGLAAYFADNFSVNLPQAANAGAATVPDTYISSTVL